MTRISQFSLKQVPFPSICEASKATIVILKSLCCNNHKFY